MFDRIIGNTRKNTDNGSNSNNDRMPNAGESIGQDGEIYSIKSFDQSDPDKLFVPALGRPFSKNT